MGLENVNATTNTIKTSMPITAVLASAGQTLEGDQAEVVLQPLRLAFETKNIKLVEAALDCLHVWYFFMFFFFDLLVDLILIIALGLTFRFSYSSRSYKVGHGSSDFLGINKVDGIDSCENTFDY